MALGIVTGFDHASLHLIPFDGLKQSLKIPLPKSIVFFALNEFEKHRAKLGLGKDL